VKLIRKTYKIYYFLKKNAQLLSSFLSNKTPLVIKNIIKDPKQDADQKQIEKQDQIEK
jgi:hypothetical protein